MGTPAYLAPEQIEGGSIDGRADVYSLGCLLYECLTGETPFARGSRLAVAWAHLEEEPPRASDRRPELPEAIDAVIRKAMAKEPDDRYATCAALITAAEEALELRRPPAALRRRLAIFAAVATSSVLVALVAACSFEAAAARRRRRAGRQGRHARPDRPCDQHGQCGHKRRPETLRDRRRRAQRLGLQRWRAVGHGDRPATKASDTQRGRRRTQPSGCLRGTGVGRRRRRRLARRRRRARKVVSHAGLLGVSRESRVPAADGPCGRGRLRCSLGRLTADPTTNCCASTRPPAKSTSGHASPAPRRSTASPPASAASGSWPRREQRFTRSTLARHA